jgi:hypothetical protein
MTAATLHARFFVEALRAEPGFPQPSADVGPASASLKAASVVTLKPATCGHFKTGHFGWPET